MRLDILKQLNAERAARRAAIVVTNQDTGAQRLVLGKDVANDPLRSLLEKHLRSGKSGTADESPRGTKLLEDLVLPGVVLAAGRAPWCGRR